MIRRAAVAGTWYPGEPARLAAAVDRLIDDARATPPSAGDLVALVAPHAGLMYSGHVAAAAYRHLRGTAPEVVVLVGPSHYSAFDGVAAWPRGVFETPLGPLPIDETLVRGLCATGSVHVDTRPHAREHSLELQLPFVRRLLDGVPIVPLVMGYQTRATVEALAAGLARVLDGRRAVIVASSDLSHFFDVSTARALDDRVVALVAAFDTAGVMARLEEYPEGERGRFVMCGGGPVVSVMSAAATLGASQAAVLAQATSGDVSGDFEQVVGYMAAAFVRTTGTETRRVAH